MPASSQPKGRIRRDAETTKALILDATEKLMIEEGYAAVSTRRIAKEIGVNAATVHYHYATTDDVFMALHKRMTERQMGGLEDALNSDDPMRALWAFQSRSEQSTLGVEFLALANHRKSIQDALAGSTNRARTTQAAMLGELLSQKGIGSDKLPPIVLGTILVSLGRLLANEARIGITTGHDDVREFVDRALDKLSPE